MPFARSSGQLLQAHSIDLVALVLLGFFFF